MPESGPPTAEPIAYLPWGRYLECIRADADRLLRAASLVLDLPVETCPGWTMADLLRHVAAVFAHKVECIRAAAPPDDWPPAEYTAEAGEDPVALLQRSTVALLDELGSADPHTQRYTWGEPHQTNGLWFRRMALEVAIHRLDAELARVDEPGRGESVGVAVHQIPDDLALDGIDEVLRIMLAGPWWHGDFHTAHPVDAAVRLTSRGRSWTVTANATAVVVRSETASQPQTEIAGAPHDLLCWLWGRGPIEALSVAGEDGLADELRARVAESQH